MTFRDELTALINRHSLENESDTPDFLLAEYIIRVIAAFDQTTSKREKWYGRSPQEIENG